MVITVVIYKTYNNGIRIPLTTEHRFCKCRVNYDATCRNLYDQIAMFLKKKTIELDLILYKRDTRDVRLFVHSDLVPIN